jgi:very-short-patch-repair endonuclease
MPPCDVTTKHGIPITTLARTIIDLAEVLPYEHLELALESACRLGLRPDYLGVRALALARRGRRGPSRVSRLLRDRGRVKATESVLETQTLQLIRLGGLPPPQRQQVISDAGGAIARVDFIYDNESVVVEVDGRSVHVRQAQWESDLRRRNLLTSRGWLVLHVTYGRLHSDPDGVVSEIRSALALRSA